MINYAPVLNPILDAIGTALKEKQTYCVVRMTRAVGKTRNIMFAIIKLLENNPGWIALVVTDTKRQAKENVQDSGYLANFGVIAPDWRHTDSQNYVYKNGSVLMFSGTSNALSLQRNRGKHPNLIYHDEAQLFNDPHRWLPIFGAMGRDKNCLKIVSGTGGKDSNNLLTFIENQVKAGTSSGTIVRKTIEDIINDDNDLESKKERQLNFEREWTGYTVFKEDIDGQMVEVVSGKDVPEIRREYYVEDIGGETRGGLAFPGFSEANIIEGEYKIDFDKPIFVFGDYGSNDPYGALFGQVVGDELRIFAEFFRGSTHTKNWITYASDMANILAELGLGELEEKVTESQTGNEIEIERYTINFLHKQIYFFGDQHGHTNWNPNLMFYFNTDFSAVGEAQNGLEGLSLFIKTKQLKIYDTCPTIINHLQTIQNETDETKIRKFHLTIDHNKSHLVGPLLYMVEYITNEGLIPVVRKPEDKMTVIETEKSIEKQRLIPATSFGPSRMRNFL